MTTRTKLTNLFRTPVDAAVTHGTILVGLKQPMDTPHRNLAVATLDDLVCEFTAFDSFLALLNADGGYRPTIRCYDKRVWKPWERRALELLADAYDQVMTLRGDKRRAYRGQNC